MSMYVILECKRYRDRGPFSDMGFREPLLHGTYYIRLSLHTAENEALCFADIHTGDLFVYVPWTWRPFPVKLDHLIDATMIYQDRLYKIQGVHKWIVFHE